MGDLVGMTLLDRYFLRSAAGSGGMADVYIAWDKLRSAKMAIKVLRRDLAESPRFFQMFAKEAELLRRLEHPNIVRLYEFNKQGDIAFIVMDWIEGSNVRQALSERKRAFTLEEVAYILQPVCSALHYAHQNKVYHCDVKPANILLHVDGRVLLTDFGVARLATEQVGGGTPPYMAPEQFAGGQVTAQTDIYALGITIYEMLSGGQAPFRGNSSSSQGASTNERIGWEHLNLPLPPLRQHNKNVPESIELFLSTALHKEPEMRFTSMLALRDAFESARTEAGRGGGITQTIVTLITPQPPKPETGASSQPAPPQRAVKPPRQVRPPVQSPPPQSHPPTPLADPKPSHRKRKAPSVPGVYSKPPSTGEQIRKLFDRKGTSTGAARPPSAASARAASRAGPNPHLLGRTGERQGGTIPIPLHGLSIGRGPQCQVRLSESSVSRLHATLLRTRSGVILKDENSALGTYVNNQRITAPTQLRSGDVIRIGYYQVFEFRER